MDWFETINNTIGAVSEAGSVIPGPIGFGSNLINIASTATSSGLDAGIAAAGTSCRNLPLQRRERSPRRPLHQRRRHPEWSGDDVIALAELWS